MSPARRLLLTLLCTLGTVGCDQATKEWATEHLRGTAGHSFLGGALQLRHAENEGGFLSLGAGLSEEGRFLVFTVGVGALLIGLFGASVLVERLLLPERLAMLALGAGGLSNWIDRVTNDGKVVDFLILQAGPLRTGVFNVADVVIMAAIPLLLLQLRRPASPPAEPEPGTS